MHGDLPQRSKPAGLLLQYTAKATAASSTAEPSTADGTILNTGLHGPETQ
jgi:hypothetical protein